MSDLPKNIRIEEGPKLVKAVATEKLLSDDVTASYYAVGAIDAAGNVIEEGGEFSYLDYGGNAVEGKHVFYVYKRRELSTEDQEREKTTYTYRYDEVGTRATYEAALELAHKVAAE